MPITDSIEECLLPACEQVLETMFFTGVLSAEKLAAGEEPRSCAAVIATVKFEGPPDGALCVGMEAETAVALASTFLGLDPPDVTDADCRQVVGEMANMMCGSVLSRVVPESSLRLASPVVRDGQETPCGPACAARAFFTLPEGGLHVCVGAVS